MSDHALRILRSSLFGALALGLGLLPGGRAEAASPFLVVPEQAEAESSPAYRFANMTNDEAFAELDRRQIPYTRVDVAPGVRAPIRLAGRLHGVYIHSSVPLEERATTMFEILDARLALALDDFAAVLERHDIDEVVHYTMYRPNVAREDHGPRDVAQQPRPPSARPGRRAAVSTAGQARTRAGKGAPKAADKTPTKAADPAPEKAPAKAAVTPPAPDKAPAKAAIAPPAPEKTPARAAAPAPAKTPAAQLPAAVAPDKSALGMKKPSEGSAPSGKKQKSPAQPAPKPREVVAAEAPAAKVSAPAEVKPAQPAPKSVVKPALAEKVAKAPAAPAPAPAPPPRPRPRTTWAPPGTRHPAGLAIDVGLLHKRDGTWLSVESHFHGHIGAQTCGEGVAPPQDPRARELRELVCESQAGGIFTYVLTPNYNAAHADHYHMEIKPGVHWFLFH
jgi:hypothetical protein